MRDVIRDYYQERYGKPSTVILYGAPILDRDPPPDLARHGIDPDVEPGRFLLYVSRLEPENQADLVIRAYRKVAGDLPLLIVGDAPYADAFKARLRELAAGDPRVRLTGAIYGDGYRDLQRSALAYIQATSVGGTHPALVEAMGAGNLVLAYGTPENRGGPGGDRPAVRLGDAAHVPVGRRRRQSRRRAVRGVARGCARPRGLGLLVGRGDGRLPRPVGLARRGHRVTEATPRSTTIVGPLVVVGVTYLVFFAGGYFGIYDVRVRISSLVIVGVVLAIFLIAAMRSSHWFPRSRLWPALAVGIAVLAIDTVFSRNPRISLDFLAYGVILAALYLLLCAMLARDDLRPRLGAAMVILAFALDLAYMAAVVSGWVTWWGVLGSDACRPCGRSSRG